MAYNTKPIITDVDGNPISQYYNPDTDKYEPLLGGAGANRVILYNEDGSVNNSLSLVEMLNLLSQLTGTVIDEETRKANEISRNNNEEDRQSNEDIRNRNETERVQSEDIRISNEVIRESNENTRKENELDRVNLYEDLMNKLNSGYFDGKNLEFHWRGTELGVRVEGDLDYVYVDLKGDTGSIDNLNAQHIEEALGYTPADKTELENLAGEGRTVETIKGNSDKISILNTKVSPETPLTTTSQNLSGAVNEVKDELDAHKAEATNKIFKLQNWELQNRNRSTKPIVTFIDDDGKAAVLTKLKPLSQVYGVPFTLALYVKAIEDEADTYMSRSDVKTLQDTLGWEMSSHTYNHLNLTTLTDEEQEYQMKHSKKVMESWGLDVSTLCYPYDGRNDKSYELARKYYRAARRSYGGVNTAPLETFELRSTCLGSWFDTQGANPYPTNSLDYYKYQVDQAIDNNGWTIFLTHCADPDHDSIQQQYLEETIQYCIQRGIEIVTFNEGLNRMGNIIDVGHYSKIDTSKKHFVLGADGTVATKDIQDLSKMTGANEYTATTKPSEFEFGKMYITRITVAGATGFPSNKAGTLITNAITGFTAGLPYLFQEYHVYDSEEIYKRVGKSNGTWGLWERVDSFFVRLSSNVVTPDTPASEFRPGKISICQITTSGAAGFPLSSAGILTTNRFAGISGFAFQEYDVYNSWSKFKRYQLASGSWSEWKEINMS